jgi:uncharacterized membrane protein
MKQNILVLVILLAMSLIGFASAVDYDSYNCPRGGMMAGLTGGYGAGMMFFGWIIYLLIIVLIVAAIYWLVKSANKKR